MADIAEYAVGAYLQFVLGCQFVLYNQPVLQEQGELDVLGIKETDGKRNLFVCEVAFHLHGLRYSQGRATDGPGVSARKVIHRLEAKFRRASEAVQRMFPAYTPTFQFWTLRSRPGINELWPGLCDGLGLQVEFVHDAGFTARLEELRAAARASKSYVDNPFFRSLQIIEHAR